MYEGLKEKWDQLMDMKNNYQKSDILTYATIDIKYQNAFGNYFNTFLLEKDSEYPLSETKLVSVSYRLLAQPFNFGLLVKASDAEAISEIVRNGIVEYKKFRGFYESISLSAEKVAKIFVGLHNFTIVEDYNNRKNNLLYIID